MTDAKHTHPAEPLTCEDCGDEPYRVGGRRRRCPRCGFLVCAYCWHHVHDSRLGAPGDFEHCAALATKRPEARK
jgi:hypothetical protein